MLYPFMMLHSSVYGATIPCNYGAGADLDPLYLLHVLLFAPAPLNGFPSPLNGFPSVFPFVFQIMAA